MFGDVMGESEIENAIDLILASGVSKDRDAIRKKIDVYLNKYLIDEIGTIVNLIIYDNHLITAAEGTTGQIVDIIHPISLLLEGMVATIVARVNDVHHFQTDKGKDYLVLNVNDDSGVIAVRVWDTASVPEKGSVYRFGNCKVKTYKGAKSADCDNANNMELCDVVIEKDPFDLLIANAVDPSTRVVGDTIVIHGIVNNVRSNDTRFGVLTTGIITIKGKGHQLKFWGSLSIEDGDEVCIDNVTVKDDRYGRALMLANVSNVCRR